MKLIFAGTRGEIEEENQKHRFHSSLIVEENDTSILIDIGVKHSENLYKDINKFDAILITHAHPDHYLWTIKKDDFINIPIYSTEKTLNYSQFKPKNFVVFLPQKKFYIKNFEITAFNVIHSLRCPAVCFKIKTKEKQIVYAPDILDTEEKKEIVDMIEHREMKNILLPGFVNNPVEYLQAADVYLSTSLSEGLPYTLLESLMCALPIVASYVRGNNEVVENNVNGFLFDLRNTSHASQKIIEIKSDYDNYKKLSDNARKIFLDKFTEQKMIFKLKEVYEKYLL